MDEGRGVNMETFKFDNQVREAININELDKELMDFSAIPFTTSACSFVIIVPENGTDFSTDRMHATEEVLSLINKIESTYPPPSDTDISGIEEIYD